MGKEAAFDLILAGGWFVDGTGAPGRPADVGIRGDRIVAVGDLSAMDAPVRRDVTGLTVTPGFIDTHSHDDNALLSTPAMPFKVSQGVTTVVVGNCGISLAPLLPESEPPRPLDLIGDRPSFRFPRFDDYLTALDAAPPAVNAVCLAGHITLRASTMDRPHRPADAGKSGPWPGGWKRRWRPAPLACRAASITRRRALPPLPKSSTWHVSSGALAACTPRTCATRASA